MRTFALGIFALGFGLTSVYLYWQLEAERSRSHALQQQHAVCPQPSSAPLPPAANVHTFAPPPIAAPATSINAAVSGPPRAFTPLPMPQEQREYLTRRRYGALFRELALSEDDIHALVPLLSEQDQRASKPIPKSRVAADGSILPDPDEPRLRASAEAEIAALIGPERAAKLMESRKTLAGRAQMRGVRMRLEDSEEPVSDQQLQQLMAAAKDGKVYASFPRHVEGESAEESTKRFDAWQDENEQQARADAAGVLTPNQLKLLDEEMASQKRMRELRRPNMLRFQAQASAGAAAP